MQNKGFTLAEVLIALAIIGIVAALTIPTIIKNYQKQETITKLKKIYTELYQAVGASEAKNGYIATWNCWGKNISAEAIFEEYLLPYLKIKQITTLTEAKKKIVYKQISGAKETDLAIMGTNAKIYALPQGTHIFMNPETYNNGLRFTIYADLNGFRGPNQFGKDLFSFSVYKDKGVHLHSLNDKDTDLSHVTRAKLVNGSDDGGTNYNYQCNKSGRGMWCGALIQFDGWQIKEDYPW